MTKNEMLTKLAQTVNEAYFYMPEFSVIFSDMRHMISHVRDELDYIEEIEDSINDHEGEEPGC